MKKTQQTYQVITEYGIHARPAAEIVTYCKSFDEEIELVNSTSRINAKSILDWLSLGVEYQEQCRIIFHENGQASETFYKGLEALTVNEEPILARI